MCYNSNQELKINSKQFKGGCVVSNEFKNTPKSATFQHCDENLVAEILAYQENKGLPTFISAIRQLCNIALQEKD